MVDSNQEISKEPLWSIPQPVQERLGFRVNGKKQDKEYNHFLLCGLYSAVALTFLLLFGFAALSRGESAYAMVIFSFAAATVVIYGSAWYTQHYIYTRHFLTLLMGLLCLYLFYTGGTANSGPLYYFVFPLVAVFLQGLRNGIISVVLLIAFTLLLEAGLLKSFDPDRYNSIFIIRVLAIYLIISMLAFLFEYFRVRAERELMLSVNDLNQMTYGDIDTSLANRRLMEKLLVSELNRTRRYSVSSCLMLIEPDPDPHFRIGHYQEIRLAMAEELRRHLRMQDIPGCWDASNFLVLLPETSVNGARALAERLLMACHRHTIMIGSARRQLSLSISIVTIQGESPDTLVFKAHDLVLSARREGGNRIKLDLAERENAIV